jgi:excisionase family DNA binding protein
MRDSRLLPLRSLGKASPVERKLKSRARRDLRVGNEPGEPVLLLTVPQVCQRMQCGKRGLYQLINSGELASVKIGGVRRIPVSAVEDFLEAIRANSRQPRSASRFRSAGSGGGSYGA